MNEHAMLEQNQGTKGPPQPALIAAVLLFVGLYIAGIVMSIAERSQRESTG